MEADQPYELFWRLTLREIGAILDGATAKLRREHNERAWMAWHSAALGRIKKFPKLQTLLRTGDKPKRRQTVDEMIAIAQAWTASVQRARR